MSAEGPLPRNGDTGATTEEVELAQVLESYLAQLEAGRPADPDGLIAAHPELARPLRACLKVMHLAQGLDEPGELPAGTLPVDPDDSGTVPPSGSSALTALWPGDGRPPRVLLPEPPEDESPVVRTHSDALLASLGGATGRYQVLGEIARGGMGVVLKARDADLGRDLALKVLLDRHRGDQDVVRRFVEEAQIGGQLQHPGIVPVHELGTLADLRPFFAMRLVKGRTLAALLAERPSPAAGLPRFLPIFEAVCQTVAYAHARRVIHRDLKPANVMVGNFGEVQVMDWGLAKVLAEGGIADEAKAMEKAETVILTVRSGSVGSGSESQAGSVLGTPAYMAPEQARGDVERIDERADVFGLGAILCEILTGRPPYVGSTREQIRDKAARGDLADALGRLVACAGDGELIDLARDCLAAQREQRPRSAGDVSRRLTAYLAGVQERLKAAELARVEAQARAEEETKRRAIADELAREARARAEEERKRRRTTVALAASMLMTAGLVGGGWTFLARQRAARLLATTRVVADALAEAERLRGQAQAAGLGDLTKWTEAMGAVARARDLLAEGEADNALQQRVASVLAGLKREQGAAQKRAAEVERDRKLLADLETIRGNQSEHWDAKQTDAEYAAAFRGFGIDLDQLDPKEAGNRIAQRSAPVELASYLNDWVLVRRKARGSKEDASWRRLLAAAQAADPDAWRVTLRDQIGRGDRETLRHLAADQKASKAQPALSLVLLAAALKIQGDRDRSEEVLRRAWRLDPGDFWINFQLGLAQSTDTGYARPEEAARFLSGAVTIRPRSFAAHNNLGLALIEKSQLDEAIAEFRTAIRLKPDYWEAHSNLGLALVKQGKPDEAIAEHREALRLKPDSADAHYSLGLSLGRLGRTDLAMAEYRTAIRLEPVRPMAHNNLGTDLAEQGKLEEAMTEFRTALRLKPDLIEAHTNLGNALRTQRKFEEAIAELREALRLNPGFHPAHVNLGLTLAKQGKLEEAIAEYREALRLKPDLSEARYELGFALRYRGEFTEAIAELRKARDLARANPQLARQIERVLSATEREGSLAPRLPAVLAGKLKPGDGAESLGFAQLCHAKNLYGASARLWAEAFQAQPKLADDMQAQNRYNAACDAALAGSGQGMDDPPPDDAAKARWRKQAIDWLKADLAARSKLLDSGTSQARQSISQTLEHWKADTDLAGLRDAAPLAKLAADEQKACRAVWAEVDVLLAKARAGTAK